MTATPANPPPRIRILFGCIGLLPCISSRWCCRESTLEKEISHLGHLYLAPNFLDRNDENSPSVIPKTRLIIRESMMALN